MYYIFFCKTKCFPFSFIIQYAFTNRTTSIDCSNSKIGMGLVISGMGIYVVQNNFQIQFDPAIVIGKTVYPNNIGHVIRMSI